MRKYLPNKENVILFYLAIVTGIYPVLIAPANYTLNSVIFHYLLVFLFFFGVPCLIIKFILKEKIRNYGVNLNNFSKAVKLILPVLAVLFVLVWFSSFQKEFQSEYPLAKDIIGQPVKFFIIEIIYIFYYIGWEFLFRGFVLFGLEKRLGAFNAIMIQTIPSVLLHYTKPTGEIILALIAGFALGYYVLKYRTILPAIIIHFLVGVMMDIFVILHL